MLLQDIRDYLSGSKKGLQRVFVNVDYHLSQPEILPSNRYPAMEDYIGNILLPEVEYRIKSWDQSDQSYKPLAVPAKLSLVTLTGWLLSYPINYVLPGRGSKSESEWCEEHEEEEEQDNGRNALANQELVVTRVILQPNEKVDGLHDHCMLSFSYPSELAERFKDRSSPSPPPSPLSPAVEDDEFRFDRPSNGNCELSPRLPSSESFDRNRPLPFSNPDICAAGRSFLTHLHSRFQKQTIWKAWEVGQQSVVLPVVAM
ncbi:hypothetical protein BGZ76_011179 [Entomortierella beljakovae]|nr:hypothetical protein BGZ76_011179 [Entomortierella beljakovae]